MRNDRSATGQDGDLVPALEKQGRAVARYVPSPAYKQDVHPGNYRPTRYNDNPNIGQAACLPPTIPGY